MVLNLKMHLIFFLDLSAEKTLCLQPPARIVIVSLLLNQMLCCLVLVQQAGEVMNHFWAPGQSPF